MVFGIATRKLTITLPEDQLTQVREIVNAGITSSVSAFVPHALGVALFDAAGWQEMLETTLLRTGGPLKQKERAWADALLSPKSPRKGHGTRRAA